MPKKVVNLKAEEAKERKVHSHLHLVEVVLSSVMRLFGRITSLSSNLEHTALHVVPII